MYWRPALDVPYGAVCLGHEQNSETVLVALDAGQVHHRLPLGVLVVHLGASLYQSLEQAGVLPPGRQVHGGVPQRLLGVSHLLLGLGVEELLADVVVAGLQGTEQGDTAAGVLLEAELLSVKVDEGCTLVSKCHLSFHLHYPEHPW